MGLWEKYVVPPLVSCACSTKPIMKQRAKVVPRARGKVLELGCGSGTNFDYYSQQDVERLYALEPSGGMIKRAQKKAEALGWRDRIEFMEAGAEAVPLEDNSIDTVIITFVLCTIPDWEGALSEARRVLKPGGEVLFSEHGLAPDEGIAKWQRRIEPVWKPLAGGCHLTRDTGQMLTGAGFALEGMETMYLPKTPKIAGFVCWGAARVA
ncbi:class I SAM-dependent methyltransferase [Henriciella aquimarina]|uniref:class I SAM-dependent methyltransferase n=1 Tax=Henriciella aquimarina TaxID=545261 RepID=UPI0009FEECBA|nr:class I SAM-dependent methyltransferase [Henriciella aquimarina]